MDSSQAVGARRADPVYDAGRLAAVASTGLMDTPGEEGFDRLARLAALLLEAPSAFVTLVDAERSFWKSAVGAGDVRQNLLEESFCQYVVRSDAPLLVDDAALDAITCGNPSIASMGVRAWAGVPVHAPGGEVLGSFCVVDIVPRAWTARDLVVLETLAAAAESEVSLHVAARREQRAHAGTSLLARTNELLSGRLDTVEVLHGLVRLAVADFASWCTAWVADGDRLHALASARTGREDEDTRQLLPPVPVDGASVSARAWRAGRPVLVDDLPAAYAEGAGPADEPMRAVVTATGVGPACSLPLRAGNEQIGVLTFLRLSGEPGFEPAELDLAQELADRAARVLAAARSYEAQRDSAVTLQRALLPVLPQLEEVTTAARYHPGSVGHDVGGDFYDVLDLGAGRLGVAVGDVMGRGLHAAAVMGQLRVALRAYARLDLPPAQLLGLLEGLVTDLDGPIVTCLYGVYDPAVGLLSFANAGHPAPLLRRGDGEVVALDGPVGAPLGAGEPGYDTSDHAVGGEDVLCLFTDGLVEDRVLDAESGTQRVSDALRAGDPDDLERLSDEVLTLAPLGDDVALLLLRVARGAAGGSEPPRRQDVLLPTSGRPAREARVSIVRAARAWGVTGDVVDAAELVVSELVTNAERYGAPPLRLRLRATGTSLFVEVFDVGRFEPRRRHAAATDEGGRGLELVAALARRWGSRPTVDGKAVWAELAR